jgi:hypothetical protein
MGRKKGRWGATPDTRQRQGLRTTCSTCGDTDPGNLVTCHHCKTIAWNQLPSFILMIALVWAVGAVGLWLIPWIWLRIPFFVVVGIAELFFSLLLWDLFVGFRFWLFKRSLCPICNCPGWRATPACQACGTVSWWCALVSVALGAGCFFVGWWYFWSFDWDLVNMFALLAWPLGLAFLTMGLIDPLKGYRIQQAVEEQIIVELLEDIEMQMKRKRKWK